MTDVDEELNQVFRALGDTTRRRIIDELAARDRQSLFEICARLTAGHGIALTRQAFSRHLTALEAAGIIAVEWQGKTKLHSLNRESLARLNGGWISTYKEVP